MAATRLPGDRSLAGGELAPDEALARARNGDLVLVDIRRPDEWRATGVPAEALPIDMRRDDLIEALDDALAGDRTRPLAVICARGVRSRRLSARLDAAGFSGVIDVPEGMLGSRAGPGWLARGLPVIPAPSA